MLRRQTKSKPVGGIEPPTNRGKPATMGTRRRASLSDMPTRTRAVDGVPQVQKLHCGKCMSAVVATVRVLRAASRSRRDQPFPIGSSAASHVLCAEGGTMPLQAVTALSGKGHPQGIIQVGREHRLAALCHGPVNHSLFCVCGGSFNC